MSAPQVGDVVTLISLCNRVATLCGSGPSSAKSSLNELRAEVESFTFILRQLRDNVRDDLEAIPSDELEDTAKELEACMERTEKTLKDCKSFLEHNEIIVQPSGSRRLSEWPAHIVKLAGTSFKYATLGDQEVKDYQKNLSSHKQSITLVLSFLHSKKMEQMEQKLEAMIRGSVTTDIDQLLKDNRKQQRFANFVLLSAENGADADAQWQELSSGLVSFHYRIINTIERRANREVQHGPHTADSDTEYRMIAPYPPNGPMPAFPRRRHHLPSIDEGSSSLGTSAPSIPTRLPANSGLDATSRITSDSPLASPRTHTPSVASIPELEDYASSNPHTEPHESGSPPVASSSRPDVENFPIPVLRSNTFAGDPADAPEVASAPHWPPEHWGAGMEVVTTPNSRRDSASSTRSALYSWRTIALDGQIEVSWNTSQTPTPCGLEAGYANGVLRAIRAFDKSDPARKFIQLRGLSGHGRPIPQTEPNDNRIYFTTPPKTKNGEEPIYFVDKREDHIMLQSLIYGRKLLFFKLISKISSDRTKESERQYLRVWETDEEGHGRRILYLKSSQQSRTYRRINASEIDLGSQRVSSNGTVLKFNCRSSTPKLTIEFLSSADLNEFRSLIFLDDRQAVTA